MKFLFLTIRSPATVYAVAPLATAVRNAGHEILLAANEPLIATAGAIGLPAIAVTSEPIAHYMPADRPVPAPGEPIDVQAEIEGFGRAFARMAAAGFEPLLELADDWPPDLIVAGSMGYAGGLLATHLKIPYVRHAEYLAIPITGIDPVAEAELRPELEREGLTGLPKPDLFIDVTPPSLRPPAAGDAQSMRWVPSSRLHRVEPWMYIRPTGRHRVLITSGLTTPGWSMRRLVDQLTAAGAEVLIAAPPSAAEKLGAELENVRIGWIPLDVAAPTCDLVVHHGGGIPATTTMAAGIPQLIIPENPHSVPDNYYRDAIAQALSGFGAALTVAPQAPGSDEDPADVIAAGCQEVLSTASYTQQARALAKEIATLPTPAGLVRTLEELAAP